MIIGERLRALREQKKMSQGDIEKRTGLLRCYISRVENGHTVPAIETLEKISRALDLPLHEFLYDGEEPPRSPVQRKNGANGELLWGSSGKDGRMVRKLQQCLSRMSDEDRKLLLFAAEKMAKQKRREKTS